MSGFNLNPKLGVDLKTSHDISQLPI